MLKLGALTSAPYEAGRSQIWLPRPALASCVLAVMSRSTLGLDLDDARRYNHFPVTPSCTLVWYLSGECDVIAPGHPAAAQSPREHMPVRSFVAGPKTQPLITFNPGPVHVLMLVLLPEALKALTGIDPGSIVDSWLDATALDDHWRDLEQRLRAARDDDMRVALINDFLLPRWRHARPATALHVQLFDDWSQNLALRAATSGWGRSLRQTERRIKQWTGQPLRQLRGIGRSERAFHEAMAAIDARGDVDWSEVAHCAGYADQAHLCRETRRMTGFSPEELRQRVARDESFWCYRLWSMRGGRQSTAN